MNTHDPLTITTHLAEFTLALDPGRVPEEIRHETARIFLDCVGCAVAGLVTDAGRIAVDLVRGESGPLLAHVPGQGRVSLLPAVFANTILTNALDFEPVGPEGHVCAVAVPVALAVADAVDASGKELLAALLVGLEVGGRVGGAIRRPEQGGAKITPSVRGTAHAAFAAAAAAGRLLGLSRDQMTNAFGIAAYGATLPTLKKVMTGRHAPMTKYDHLGAMARNGVEAALLAQRGFTGDAAVLEGDVGFWRFAGALGCDWDFFTRDLGTTWTIPQTWFKRYPVILYSTPGVDLARQIATEHDIRSDAIEQIIIRTSRINAVQTGHDIQNGMDAWTSYPYNVACGLAGIRPWRAWQEPRSYRDPALLDLASRVTIADLPREEVLSVGNYWDGWNPAVVELRSAGTTHRASVDRLPRLDDAEVTAKFRDNVGGLLNSADAAAVEAAAWDLTRVPRARTTAARLNVGSGPWE